MGEQQVCALINTGVTHNFLEVNTTNKLGIKYEGHASWLKAVNSKPKVIFDIAHWVQVCLGKWSGRLDSSLVELDDYPMVLDMEFINKNRVVPIPFTETMFIVGDRNTTMVPLSREELQQAKTISTMTLSWGEIPTDSTVVRVMLQGQSGKPKGIMDVQEYILNS